MLRALVLLSLVAVTLSATPVLAGGGGNDNDKDRATIQRRSDSAVGSFPGGPPEKAPLSTGYYIVDSDGPFTGPPWAPSYAADFSPENSWRRILSGPRQRDSTYWKRGESMGLEYFRNPNDPNDSTDNAFAGPISIGFPFYYYGRKYDSFYVSTNGLIALSNRRYQYDERGNRVDYESVYDDTRPRAGDAAADPARDDYGYNVVATGGTPTSPGTSPTGGILNPDNTRLAASSEKAVIAALWDDTELSQVHPTTREIDEFGRVLWRRTDSSIVIWYVNQSMKGAKNIPVLGTQSPVTARALRANYQVVLNRMDSSVQINYINFPGFFVDQSSNVINVPSNAMFAANATVGVQSHDGEFTNYLYNVGFPGGGMFANGTIAGTPHAAQAIRFKQWKNVMRVLNVTFQTPSIFTPGAWVDLPPGTLADNYELLLGSPKLGVVRPVGTVQNVSSDVGPVNVTRQPIRFGVVFRIRDLVNVAQPPVYQRSMYTGALWPIYGADSASRPNTATLAFDPYITNPNVPRQIGRFRAEVIAVDQAPDGSNYGQEWSFDDTTGVRLFGIKRLEIPFVSTFDKYSVSPEDGVIPSVQEWVSIGPSVVDGDANTWNPPPPRGAAGPLAINSPVCLLDRRDPGGAFYNNNLPGRLGGDTLISFPINLSQATANPIILLSYQRTGKVQGGFPRGFSDLIRVGPEHAVYNTVKDQKLQEPDKLVVEFAEPVQDDISGIVNIRDGAWRDQGFNARNDRVNWGASSPRWGVFGGGGGSGPDTNGKIVVDEFDAGKDFEFYRAYIPIPNRWARSNPANRYFRFRIRAESKMDGNPIGSPADDGDAFYVDNVMLVEPDKPEIEAAAVRVDWPYTEAPASQARAIPLSVKIANNGRGTATTFGVAVSVENLAAPPLPGLYNYYRYQSVISLAAGRDRVENFPTWNAQECGTQFQNTPRTPPNTVSVTDYRITARILPVNYDSYGANDATYTDFRLQLGSTFAYDDGTNDVPTSAGLTGKGLNLVPPSNQDGAGSSPFGPSGGSSSGTFAMQFRILTRDTVRGFRAFYGAANAAPDFVMYGLYKHTASPNSPPVGAPVVRAYARRGEGVEGRRYDQFVTYLLDTPYVVEPGLYFATVAQLGQTGLELGGDASRMGQVTTIRSDAPPVGVGNYSIAAYPEMRQNRFWYEVTTESGGWNPMMTITNNPGYPHLNHRGQVGPVATNTRGSWIPMIRPYFGLKNSTACGVEPVELAAFEVTPLSDALRLDWRTASEIKNHGFYVERRTARDEWADVGFQAGNGTTNRTHLYEFVDRSVAADVTYQYRLRQEDDGGAVTYSAVKEGRLSATATCAGANVLRQNVPNPMTGATRIDFSLIESGPVTVEIVDVFGKTLWSTALDAKAGGGNSVEWDGRDAAGVPVPSGTYVYKLMGTNFAIAKTLSVTR